MIYRWQACEKLSTLLVTSELQTETTIRYHYTLFRMDKIKKSDPTKFWWGNEQTEHLIQC